MLTASPRLPLESLPVQNAVTDDRQHFRINPQGDSFGNTNQIHAPRRRPVTGQDHGGDIISDIPRLPTVGDQLKHQLYEAQFESYASSSIPPTTRASWTGSSVVLFKSLASLPPLEVWLADALQELAKCSTYAHDEDLAAPSNLAIAKTEQLLNEVSAYVKDQPEIYPMEESSIAIDFRNPDSKSGILFLIEQDGSGALFHRTSNSKGRLRVDDAADLLREGGFMELKRVGIR